MKAVVIHEYGDSSKLSYEDVPIPEPGPEEVKSGRDGAAISRFPQLSATNQNKSLQQDVFLLRGNVN